MANRYWVGGNATWDATAGTKWALTSGGTGGQAVPTASDAVFLDNGTGHGNVTIATGYTAVCASLNCTGYVGTLSSASSTGNLSVSGSMTLVSGMTMSVTGTISLLATGTLTTGGKSLDNLTISGSGITVTLGSALTVTNTLTLTRGTLTTSGSNYALNCAAFSSSGSFARTLNLNASTMTISGTGTAWTTATSTSFTLSGTGSTITFSYSGASAMTISAGAALDVGGTTGTLSFTGGTYNLTKPTNFDTSGTLSFTGYAGQLQNALSTAAKVVTLSSGLTWASSSLTLTGAGGCTITMAGQTPSTFTFSGLTGTFLFADNYTFSGAVSRGSATFGVTGSASLTGTTITCGQLAFGTGGTITLSGSGAVANCTSWTGTGTLVLSYSGSSDRTVAGTGTTGVALNITAGSGGTVYLTDGTQDITCHDLKATGFSGTLSFNAFNVTVSGDLVLPSTLNSLVTGGGGALTLSGATVNLSASSLGSKWAWGDVTCSGASAAFTMTGNVDIGPKQFIFTDGSSPTFDTNGYNFRGGLYFSGASATLKLGSGTHTFLPSTGYGTPTGLVFAFGGTLSSNTSTVLFDGKYDGTTNSAQGAVSYVCSNNFSSLYSVSGSFNTVQWRGAFNIRANAFTASSMTLLSGSPYTGGVKLAMWLDANYAYAATPTLTVTTWSATLGGTAITLQGYPGSSWYGQAQLSIASGTIIGDTYTIDSFVATGGATFWAGPGSTIPNTSGGVSTGWNLGSPGAGSFFGRPVPFA